MASCRYTSSSDEPAPGEDTSSPLSPSNSNFVRNTALIAVFAGLVAFFLGILAFWLIKRCKSQRDSKSSINLESSPITPLSFAAKHASASSSHITRARSQRSADRQPHEHPAQASLANTDVNTHIPSPVTAVNSAEPDALRQARTLHPLRTADPALHESPYSGASSTSANSVQGLLPSLNQTSAISTEQHVSMSWRSNSHGEQASSSRRADRSARDSVGGAESPQEPPKDDKQGELARRLRDAGSLTSSHLPAGFCESASGKLEKMAKFSA